MSSLSAADIAELVTEAQQVFTVDCISCAVMTILAYQWIITIGHEVELVWSSQVTGATILFLANRYCSLILYIIELTASYASDYTSCKAINFVTYGLDILQYVPWAAFSAMRVYAMSGEHKLLTFTVLLLSVPPLVVNLVQIHWLLVSVLSGPVIYGCALGTELLLDTRIKLAAVSRSSLICADAIVITTTWISTLKIIKLRQLLENKPSFYKILFVNGTIYFVVLLLLNLVDIIFYLLSLIIDSPAIGVVSYIVVFIEPLTSILVSHFLLDLQAVKRKLEHQDSVNSVVSSISWNRAIGSIALPLEVEDIMGAEAIQNAHASPEETEGNPDQEDDAVIASHGE